MVNLFWRFFYDVGQLVTGKKLILAYLTHAINQIIETFEEIVLYVFNLIEKCEH